VYMWDMTHSYVQHHPFTCVYVRHDSFVCATPPIHVYICETWRRLFCCFQVSEFSNLKTTHMYTYIYTRKISVFMRDFFFLEIVSDLMGYLFFAHAWMHISNASSLHKIIFFFFAFCAMMMWWESFVCFFLGAFCKKRIAPATNGLFI